MINLNNRTLYNLGLYCFHKCGLNQSRPCIIFALSFLHGFFYFISPTVIVPLFRPRGRGASRPIVLWMSVCLRICPHAYLKNHMAELHQMFSARRLSDRGSVLLVHTAAMRYVTYFCFADDVMFSHNGSYGASYVLISDKTVITTKTTASIPAKR